MKEKIGEMVVGFFVRMVIGAAAIFFANELLEAGGVGIQVGLNGLTAAVAGTLGLPGVGLMYGIELCRLL